MTYGVILHTEEISIERYKRSFNPTRRLMWINYKEAVSCNSSTVVRLYINDLHWDIAEQGHLRVGILKGATWFLSDGLQDRLTLSQEKSKIHVVIQKVTGVAHEVMCITDALDFE